jgi:hypothetical protein
MYCYKKHAESGLLARGSLTPKGGLDPARRHFRPQWILLMAALFPGLLAALLSQQDLDTLALREESTLFVALFLKWLITIYLWTPMFLPNGLPLGISLLHACRFGMSAVSGSPGHSLPICISSFAMAF